MLLFLGPKRLYQHHSKHCKLKILYPKTITLLKSSNWFKGLKNVNSLDIKVKNELLVAEIHFICTGQEILQGHVRTVHTVYQKT